MTSSFASLTEIPSDIVTPNPAAGRELDNPPCAYASVLPRLNAKPVATKQTEALTIPNFISHLVFLCILLSATHVDRITFFISNVNPNSLLCKPLWRLYLCIAYLPTVFQSITSAMSPFPISNSTLTTSKYLAYIYVASSHQNPMYEMNLLHSTYIHHILHNFHIFYSQF